MTDFASGGKIHRQGLGVSEPSGAPRFLANGSSRDWALILDHAEVIPFTPGEVIMQAGDYERALYVLTRGAVAGSTDKGRDFKTIAAPSILGELGFIDGAARSLT